MDSTKGLFEVVRTRHSNYALSPQSTISDSRIEEIIRDVILHVPSSFNTQSTRIVVLLKEQHQILWDLVAKIMSATIPEEQYIKMTAPKLNGFRNAYGTV